MAGEERFLAGQLNAVADIDGVIGFIESLKRMGGDAEVKKIGVSPNGYTMEQPGERKPWEFEGTLQVPQAQAKAFVAKYQPEKVLARFYTSLDDTAELTKAGDLKVATCDWDAAILENNVLKVTIKLRTKGYGNVTQYTAAGGGAGGGA